MYQKNEKTRSFGAMHLIDKILHSIGMQIAGLLAIAGVIFLLLWLPTWLWFEKLNLTDSFLSFINPGSTFETDLPVFERVWAFLIGFAGMVLLGGLLISVFHNILQSRIDKVNNGLVHYRFRNHFLFIGYDKMTASIIRQIAQKQPNADIVLQTTSNVPDVRRELLTALDKNTVKNITIVLGSRTSDEDLKKLHPESCNEIFLLGETDEHDRDSLNIQCLKKINSILEQADAEAKRCHVLFENQSTYAVFQQQDIPDIKDKIDFLPFNFHECWAQTALVDCRHKKIEYKSLDREPVTAESAKHVHFVVIGMSRMGVAMGIQAMHICHFPNFITKGIKTRITFIDENADREMNFLRGRYPHLFNEIDWFYQDKKNPLNNKDNTKSKTKFTDIELEFVQGRVESPEVREEIKKWTNATDKLLTIAVCFSHSPVSIAAGLYLPDEVYDREIPVFICQETSACTLSLLSNSHKYKNVKPFGMLDDAYDLEKINSLLPKIVKYAYDQTNENKLIDKIEDKATLEENWKNHWKASDNITALKFSNIYNANTIGIKSRSLNILVGQQLSNDQINLLARIEHNRWNIEKLLMGYRACTLEEEKNIKDKVYTKQYYRDKFIHNDIRSYEDIKEDDKRIQASEYDISISKAFPFMLKEYEQSKKK